MCRNVSWDGLVVRQGILASTRWLGAACTRSGSDPGTDAVHRVRHPRARTRVGVRERRMGTSRSPVGNEHCPCTRSRAKRAAQHLYDAQAGLRLGLRERRVGAPRFAARCRGTSRTTAGSPTTSRTFERSVLDGRPVRRNRRRCVCRRRVGAERSPPRGEGGPVSGRARGGFAASTRHRRQPQATTDQQQPCRLRCGSGLRVLNRLRLLRRR